MRIGVAVLMAAVGAGGGCEHMSDTAKGAGIGGALGTGAGLAIGAATGNPKTGAVAGGLLGAGVGAAVGNESDHQKEEKREIRQAAAVAAAQQQPKMGMMDVVHMVQAGHGEAVIVNQIRLTGSTFQLSGTDLDYLKSCNVPDGVILAMQNARPQVVAVGGRRPVVVHEPATVIYERPAPVYVYGPPPPPAFGVTYIRRFP